MAIRAPFNFVPVSDKVYFPDWADQINHDIPFSDGVSGTIKLKITAESPVFVRNGHVEKDREEKNDNFKSFSNIDGEYFIPGTSLKGAIRNVLEIMSFGKMRVNKDAKFAQREWYNSELYPLKSQQSSFHCGWLKRKDKDFEIIDCGRPYRIGQTRIDEWISSDIFKNKFCQNSNLNLNKEVRENGKTFDPKTAEYKYHLIGETNLTGLRFSADEEFCNEHIDNRLKVSANGNINGTIVLTGQPGKWMWPRPKTLTRGAGKFYEFVFKDTIIQKFDLSEREFNHFKFIYSESTEWNRIKRELDSERGVPVFFRIENRKVKDFGIAYLYKLPYNKSVFDTLGENHKLFNKLDLAECMFGTENKNITLKGRVQIGNAKAINSNKDNELIFTLGSPKASYYPIYVKQQNVNNGIVMNYSTYNNSQIKGWKRYQIREQVYGNKLDYNEALDTKLIPLKSGSIFESNVYFHNLKPFELAALISSITFHNTEGCYHQIGQGKPFGLGKSKIEINDLKIVGKFNLEFWMAKFEETLSNLINCDWHLHDSIVQLFTMAKIHVNKAENEAFSYMAMSVNRNQNEFVTAKQFNEYLHYYSELKHQKVSPKSYYSEYKEKTKQEKLKQEQERKLVEKREIEDGIKKNLQALEQSRIDANKVPLSDKIAKLTKFRTIFGSVKTWMKLNNLESLTDSDIIVLQTKLSEVFSGMKLKDKKVWFDFKKWSDLDKAVGKDVSKLIFEKVTK